MTEITANTGSPLYPLQSAQRHLIDPVAFFVALIGAPLLVTALSCWLVFPVFALVFGGPAYLAIGTPVLLWHLGHHEPNWERIMGLAALSIITVYFGTSVLALITGDGSLIKIASLYCGFGFLFAVLWSAPFSWLYQTVRRDFYAPPSLRTEI